jgi:hypothetical protein
VNRARFIAAARLEFLAEVIHYNEAEPGLGQRSKRADAPYRRGRSSDWVKIKTPAGRAIDEMRAKWGEVGS